MKKLYSIVNSQACVAKLWYTLFIMSPIKPLITQFLEHIEIEKNRSRKTIENYHFYLSRFAKWAKEKKVNSTEQISAEIVRRYRLWLSRLGGDAPLQKNTQNYHLIALRAFLKYAARQGIKTLASEKVELKKIPARDINFLEHEELERFLSAPLQSRESDTIKRRDSAILELLFSTGLRVSELASLKRNSINPKKGEFAIRGKGDKYRVVFLSPRARDAVKTYLDMRGDGYVPLFIRHDRAFNPKKNPTGDDLFLTPRSIQRLVQRYSKSAGITKAISPHTLRHSYAKDLLMSGADIRSVQSLLGHASITTTQIYTHVTNQQLRKVHRALHGKKRK